MSEDYLSGMTKAINENFLELDSAIIAALPDNDEQYAEVLGQRKELVDRFPILESWNDGSGPLSLSAEERAALVRYMELAGEMENIERLAVYYAGHRDCFAYLKKIGAV